MFVYIRAQVLQIVAHNVESVARERFLFYGPLDLLIFQATQRID